MDTTTDIYRRLATLERALARLNSLDPPGAGSTSSGSTGVRSINAGTAIDVDTTVGDVTVSNTGVTSNVAGTGISVSGATGAVTVTNTGVTQIVAGANVTISPIGGTGAVTVNATSSGGVTSLTAGTGISVSASTGAVTVTNIGVTSNVAGNGISLSGGTGAVTITNNIAAGTAIGITGTNPLTIANTGVTSAVAGNGISLSGGTGAVTFTNNIAAGSGITITGTNPLTITSVGGPGNPYTAENGIYISSSNIGTDYYRYTWDGPETTNYGSDSSNQEFDGANSLPSGWAWFNQSGGSDTATVDVNNHRSNCIELSTVSQSTQLKGVTFSAPAGAWTYTARISVKSGTPTSSIFGSVYGVMGLVTTESSPGKSIGMFVGSISNSHFGCAPIYYATPTTGAAVKNAGGADYIPQYVQLAYNGSNELLCSAGDDIGNMVVIYRTTTGDAATWFTPSKIGLAIQTNCTATIYGYCDWIRKGTFP